MSAAIAFADARGLSDLSMRQLAAELDAGVMSLYNHVKDKNDLHAAMVETIAATIELPPENTQWKANLRRCAISAYRTFLEHRWLASLWGLKPGPAKNRYHEAVLRTMRSAGFSEPLACQGFHAVTMHVVGFAQQVLEMPFSNQRELARVGREILTELPEDEYPYLVEHVRFHLSGAGHRNDFKYMLDLILDGLARDLRRERREAGAGGEA